MEEERDGIDRKRINDSIDLLLLLITLALLILDKETQNIWVMTNLLSNWRLPSMSIQVRPTFQCRTLTQTLI